MKQKFRQPQRNRNRIKNNDGALYLPESARWSQAGGNAHAQIKQAGSSEYPLGVPGEAE